MDLTSFNEIYLRGKGVKTTDINYLNERLSCEMPREFEDLYVQANGFGIQIKDLFIEFWDIDQIISFNEIYEETICGEYVFFASSDEGYNSYAYKKENGEIYVFPTDCGVEDINDGKFCARNFKELLNYWKNEQG